MVDRVLSPTDVLLEALRRTSNVLRDLVDAIDREDGDDIRTFSEAAEVVLPIASRALAEHERAIETVALMPAARTGAPCCPVCLTWDCPGCPVAVPAEHERRETEAGAQPGAVVEDLLARADADLIRAAVDIRDIDAAFARATAADHDCADMPATPPDGKGTT